MEFEPDRFQQMAGLVCYYNGSKFHYLYVSHDDESGKHIRVMSCLPDQLQSDVFSAPVAIPAGAPVHLRVEVDFERLYFAYRIEGRRVVAVARPLRREHSVRRGGAAGNAQFHRRICRRVLPGSGRDRPAGGFRLFRVPRAQLSRRTVRGASCGERSMNRRDFLRQAGVIGGALAAESLVSAQARKGGAVSIALDPGDSVASAAPAQWAAGELQLALSAAGLSVQRVDRAAQSGAGALCIIASGSTGPVAAAALKNAGIAAPQSPESLALADTRQSQGGNRFWLAAPTRAG